MNDEKYKKLKAKIQSLEEQNIKLRERIKTQKIKYQEKIDKLENDKLKLKQKLESKHIIDKPFKYILDNYPEITQKIFKILNKHNVQFINRKELGKRVILLLEGDDIQKPLFSKEKLNAYLDLIDNFSLQDYRAIKYAPIIKSDKALFENYEQIVRVLKPLRDKNQERKNEFEFTEYSPKDVAIEEYDDEDEELDTTNVFKIK